MNTKDLVLNIAVNLDRISKFKMEGKDKRVKQFMMDNEYYIKEIEKIKLDKKFEKTFKLFKAKLVNMTDAEEFLTWANILQHRVKLI